MIATAPELLQALHARGLLADPSLALATHEGPERPWFVSLLLGATGWVAGILVLIFVAMTFEHGSGAGAGVFVVGIFLLAMAYGLFWAAKRAGFAAFASQAALSLSIAGQFAVLYAVGETLDRSFSQSGITMLSATALVLQVGLAALMPNRLHRTMSALFACIAWALFLRLSLWGSTPRASPLEVAASPATELATWCATWLPIAGVLFVIVRNEAAWIARGFAPVVRPVAAGLIVALAIGTLASEPWAWLFASGASGYHSFAPWPLLSAIAALAALAAAYALGSMGLAAICIGAAIGHVVHLYYTLEATLLVKAATLAAIGAACLAVAWSLKRRAP